MSLARVETSSERAGNVRTPARERSFPFRDEVVPAARGWVHAPGSRPATVVSNLPAQVLL
jgi:hypothetical protein